MNIFQIISRNFSLHSRTRKPEETVPYPVDYRGELVHDATKCTLCGTCTYVCSPGAIDVTREEEEGSWKYDCGRCTFCGKCVEYCPTKALSFLDHAAPVVKQRSEEYTFHIVEYQPCSRCGKPIIPIPFETLVGLYHSEDAAKKALTVHQLCERCRRRAHGEFLKSGISGTKGES